MRIAGVLVAIMVMIGVLFFSVVACCGILGSAGSSASRTASSSSGEPAKPKEDLGNEITAFHMAQDLIKLTLKHPDDAEFHSLLGDTSIHHTKSTKVFRIKSKVKAKNGFGAALTYPWYVEIKYLGNGNYKPQYAEFDNQIVLDSRAKSASTQPVADPEQVADTSEADAKEYARSLQEQAAAKMERERQAAEERRLAEEEAAKMRDAQFRTWRSANGQFTIEARMDRYSNGAVVLEKRDGEKIEVDEKQLSDDDQAFIQEEMKRRLRGR